MCFRGVVEKILYCLFPFRKKELNLKWCWLGLLNCRFPRLVRWFTNFFDLAWLVVPAVSSSSSVQTTFLCTCNLLTYISSLCSVSPSSCRCSGRASPFYFLNRYCLAVKTIIKNKRPNWMEGWNLAKPGSSQQFHFVRMLTVVRPQASRNLCRYLSARVRLPQPVRWPLNAPLRQWQWTNEWEYQPIMRDSSHTHEGSRREVFYQTLDFPLCMCTLLMEFKTKQRVLWS